MSNAVGRSAGQCLWCLTATQLWVFLLCAAGANYPAHAATAIGAGVSMARCEALKQALQGGWPDPSTRIVSVAPVPQGPYQPPAPPGAPPMPPFVLPEHCELVGVMHERKGVDGQQYSIRFHLRLPNEWNGRFFFQGGGGSNGELGSAIGNIAVGVPPALLQGFAVVSQDSGHDNHLNMDATRGGVLTFGFDPQARADYGHASLKVVADAAKAAVTTYYGRPPQYSYFVGCSKGGQEGMVFAQRYPDEFDGIVAADPGFALPRAALAEAWDVQSLVRAEHSGTEENPTAGEKLSRLAQVFTDDDLGLVRDAVLDACDAADGVRDGIVGDFDRCTTRRVMPELLARSCSADHPVNCLSQIQVNVLQRIFAGPKNARGGAAYSDWQWDAGVASPGWRIWKLGSADGKIPALNVVLGGASLAAVFTTPPTAITADPASILGFQLAFDLAQGDSKIGATTTLFPRSAWQDISAHSPNLDGFRAHGGKLIVPHGVSDPVFSIRDTLSWYQEVERRSNGKADRFVRIFPVPGMNHCAGGPATDNFDAFNSLRRWVEENHAPERITAVAGPSSPWPGRSRPLCSYPKVARYKGSGDVERESSFECR